MLFRRHFRTWLSSVIGLALLTALGFALDAFLPPQPRFVLRGDDAEGIAPGVLSADGEILVTGTMVRDATGEGACVSLKTWDAFDGAPRGEFFRGLVGAGEISDAGGVLGLPSDPDERGFRMPYLKYSRDRRYCAMLHREGLALADFQQGREWPTVIKLKVVEFAGRESAHLYRLLQQTIDTTKLQEKMKLKDALLLLQDALGDKLPILVDRAAFISDKAQSVPDPFEDEVCLPPVPVKMNAHLALRLMLSQIADGNAELLIRRSFIEITTRKIAHMREVWPPVFSPRGSLLILGERVNDENKLHVVECATGQVAATLPVHTAALGFFGCTPDDQLLYFFTNDQAKPVLTVWDTRERKVARTFKNVDVAELNELAPNGKTLPANNDAGGVDLLDLRSGRRRPLFDSKLKYALMFSPDSRSLVRRMSDSEMEIWDVVAGKQRGRIDVGMMRAFPSLELVISADSRVVCAITHTEPHLSAWSLETCRPLWPPTIQEPVPANRGDAGVIEVFEWTGGIDRSRTFTPDHRFLVARKADSIDILDPATGNVQSSVSVGAKIRPMWGPSFTPDGRWMLSQWDYSERKPWFGEEWLARWLPLPKSSSCIVVSEIDTGKIQIRVEDRQMPTDANLSDDGRVLLTSFADEHAENISCWDLPGRPSRYWSIGVPMCLGCCAVPIGWWVRKRNAPRLVSPNPNPTPATSGDASRAT